MSKARLIITAVITEGLSQGEAARRWGVSQGWISRLLARYRAEGEAAFEPRRWYKSIALSLDCGYHAVAVWLGGVFRAYCKYTDSLKLSGNATEARIRPNDFRVPARSARPETRNGLSW
jgi:hypothetical protein